MLLLQKTTTESDSLFKVITESGPLGIAIIAIMIILAIVGIYLYFSRLSAIKKAGQMDESFMDKIRGHVQAGSISEAIGLSQSTNTPVARMVEKGLSRIGRPMRDINTAVENVGNLEVFRLEKGLSNLATISGAAPMIGFFGTVTGMIMAFYKMSTAGDVEPADLAGGIYQALLTTAFGLFVGILAYMGYNHLVSLINKVVFDVELKTMEFLDLLEEPSK